MMGSYGGLGGALPFLNQAITCSGLSFGMALASPASSIADASVSPLAQPRTTEMFRPLQNPSWVGAPYQSLLPTVTCDAVTTSEYRKFSCD
jgi:hypothetical protein